MVAVVLGEPPDRLGGRFFSFAESVVMRGLSVLFGGIILVLGLGSPVRAQSEPIIRPVPATGIGTEQLGKFLPGTSQNSFRRTSFRSPSRRITGPCT